MQNAKKIMVLLIVLSMIVFISCTDQNSSNSNKTFQPVELFPEPVRPAGQKDVLELRREPVDTISVGFIGLGYRGSEAIRRFTHLNGTKISAICDITPQKLERALKVISNAGFPKPDVYESPAGWKKLCERDDIDLIYITTNWALHTEMAVYAMEHNKDVALAVPAAVTIDECWQLVNTSEKTQRHCLQLENSMYDNFEMTTHKMAEEGLFGEIVHAEGAYIHDLREYNFSTDILKDGFGNLWRLEQNAKRNGNLYPTHGLGPICHIMNIHRGDKLDFITSISTNQFGITEYAKANFGEDSDFAKKDYKRGDMNTSIVRTVNGKTILIQHDVTSPRPYSRKHIISGTKGFARKYPIKKIVLDPEYHSGHAKSIHGEELNALLKKYEHPLVTEISEEAKAVSGGGSKSFIMDYRLIYCLHNGLPLDLDVYDAAEWSAISELSEKSVANNGMPIKVPDFTRGAWKKLDKVTYYHK